MTGVARALTLGADRALEEPTGPTLAEVRAWPATIAVPRACSALGISRSWGYQLIAQGEFPCKVIHVGRRPRIVTAALIRMLEGES